MLKIVLPLIIFILAVLFIYQTWNDYQISEENLVLGQTFMSENAQRPEVTTTQSGLQYEVLQTGKGNRHPNINSKVEVHYEGRLLDGTVFDSSYQRNQSVRFALKQVIQGWQEGVQLMVEGEKARFYIPTNLAYGKNGAGAIPPSATLIFDVELIRID